MIAADRRATADHDGSPTKVLYIGGMGRSGSTVLDLMLDELPGFFSAGELRYTLQRGPVDDVLCSCRQPFSRCAFWQAVGERAFGGWDAVDVARILELAERVDRHRFLPFLMRGGIWRGFDSRLELYADFLSRLYGAIRSVTGCRVIVDSSKDPPYAFVLRSVPGLDIRLVHLVRDSRGVCFSWTKRVVRPEVVDRTAYMDQVTPGRMALRWIDYNVLFHLLGRLGMTRLFVRYESIVEAPRRSVDRILEHVGEPGTDTQVRRRTISGHHTISGNPVRFRGAPQVLRVDDEWRIAMDARQRRLVSAITWPLLLGYGYLLPRRSAVRQGSVLQDPAR
jgi:Sulfotransferase family